MCKTPELAARITLQPVRKFGFDAAILFSDILLPVEGMGLKLDYVPGPVIFPRIADLGGVERLRVPKAEEFGFIRKTVEGILGELPAGKDLIGFAGAPFTMTAYILEGGSGTDFSKVKKAAGSPVFHALMEKVTRCMLSKKAVGSGGFKQMVFVLELNVRLDFCMSKKRARDTMGLCLVA